jgi:hypothetical protein
MLTRSASSNLYGKSTASRKNLVSLTENNKEVRRPTSPSSLANLCEAVTLHQLRYTRTRHVVVPIVGKSK